MICIPRPARVAISVGRGPVTSRNDATIYPGVVHLNLTVTWPTMRSARAVVARAPPEILDPSDFGANAKAMGK